MLVAEKVPFRRISGHSRIFLEYLEFAPAVQSFYHRPPALPALEQSAREELARLNFPRQEMAAILHRQNGQLKTGECTSRNIDKLAHTDCVVAVTGQQVGLFAGPLYTIYKALTAIRIAEALESRGMRCVPVFWMECEDHDLAEVTHSTVVSKDGSLHTFQFLDLLFPDARKAARSVGSLSFPEMIRGAVAEYCSFLPEGEFRGNVQALLEETYAPGSGLADAFGRLMARIFQQYGLIFFNPAEPEAKRLIAPVFRRALTDSAQIFQVLRERTHDLEAAGFHSQVSVPEDSTIMFLQDDGERRSLLRYEGRFVLKNTNKSFPLEELLALCEAAPERFSPNVLLRPVIQDHLFPTVAYVGGPAEVAYFAQIEVLYRWFGRPMPSIWPRSSFTLLEPEIASAMGRAGLGFETCLGDTRLVTQKLLEAAYPVSTSARLNALAEEINKTLDDVRPAMAFTDASLGPALDTARRKVLHHVSRLQAKFTQREAHHDSEVTRNAEAILNQCLPNGALQERELGIHGFLARHGMGLLEEIYTLVDLNEFAHQAVSLEGGRSS